MEIISTGAGPRVKIFLATSSTDLGSDAKVCSYFGKLREDGGLAVVAASQRQDCCRKRLLMQISAV